MSGIQRGAGVSIESILIESIFDMDAQGEKEATYGKHEQDGGNASAAGGRTVLRVRRRGAQRICADAPSPPGAVCGLTAHALFFVAAGSRGPEADRREAWLGILADIA